MDNIEVKDRIVHSLLKDFLSQNNWDNYGIMYDEEQREFYVYKGTYTNSSNESIKLSPKDPDSDQNKTYKDVATSLIEFINSHEEKNKQIIDTNLVEIVERKIQKNPEVSDRVIHSVLTDLLVLNKLDEFGITYIEDQREFYVYHSGMNGENINLMFEPSDVTHIAEKNYKGILSSLLDFVRAHSDISVDEIIQLPLIEETIQKRDQILNKHSFPVSNNEVLYYFEELNDIAQERASSEFWEEAFKDEKSISLDKEEYDMLSKYNIPLTDYFPDFHLSYNALKEAFPLSEYYDAKFSGHCEDSDENIISDIERKITRWYDGVFEPHELKCFRETGELVKPPETTFEHKEEVGRKR